MIIDYEIIGSTSAVAELLTKLDTAMSLQAMLTFQGVEVEKILEHRASARFAQEGDDASGGWAPLLDSTIAIRQTQGYGSGPINVRTGQLEDYITNGGSQVKAIGSDTELTYPKPTSDPLMMAKVRTAQRGKNWPPTVPRPVLAVNETDMSEVMVALSFHINSALGI